MRLQSSYRTTRYLAAEKPHVETRSIYPSTHRQVSPIGQQVLLATHPIACLGFCLVIEEEQAAVLHTPVTIED